MARSGRHRRRELRKAAGRRARGGLGQRRPGHHVVHAGTRHRLLPDRLHARPAGDRHRDRVGRQTAAEVARLGDRRCTWRCRIGWLRPLRRIAMVAVGTDRLAPVRAARRDHQHEALQARTAAATAGAMVRRYAGRAVGAAVAFDSQPARETSSRDQAKPIPRYGPSPAAASPSARFI